MQDSGDGAKKPFAFFRQSALRSSLETTVRATVRALALAVAATVAASGVGCSARSEHDRTEKLAHGVTITAPDSAARIRATASRAGVRNQRALRQLAPAERLTAAGRLPDGGVILTFRVDARKVAPGTRPFLATLDKATGQWAPVPSSYDRATGAISARVRHLSVWAPFGWVNSKIAAMLKGALLSIFGFGGTGEYPQCSAYDVAVTDSHPSPPVIGACAHSVAGGEVQVKLANIRPYMLDVSYPYSSADAQGSGGSSASTQSPDLFVKLWTAAAENGHVLLPGFGEADITFPLSPGESAEITTRLDGQAFRAAMLEAAVRVATQLGGKGKEIIDALDSSSCALDYLHLGAASSLTEQNAQDFGGTAFECVSSVLPDSAGLIATGITLAASLIVQAISASWSLIDSALGNGRHTLTVQISPCPSAATVKQAVEAQAPYWRQTEFTISANVTCVGPYVSADAFNSAGSGARVLLEQVSAGLRFLVSGSGPTCTTNPAHVLPEQIVYIPPKYGDALHCVP